MDDEKGERVPLFWFTVTKNQMKVCCFGDRNC